MAFKLVPFGLAKRLSQIPAPQISDCIYLASVEPAITTVPQSLDCSHPEFIESPPTMDLPQLGGFLGNFTHIGPSKALNLERSYLLKRPESLNFPGLVIPIPPTQVIRINPVEIPTRDSIELITEADVLADNLLFDTAAVASDALDDGLAFVEPKILSSGFLLIRAAVSDHTLDDDLTLGSVAIFANPLNINETLPTTEVIKAPIDDGLVFASVKIVHALDYGLLFDKPTILKFVNLLEAPEIISPFKLMARSQTLGRDYRSRYALKEDEQAGPQLTFTDTATKCRHGKVRSQCSACLKTRTRSAPIRKEPQPQVVDVFEQLFYILQPPILPAQGQPLIFPNGHKPYPFQIGGVKWLVEHESALLADEMGLGKTIQAIIALRILFRSGELQRTLVVCPASMTNTWEREIKSWAPELRVFRLHGDKATRSEAWKSNAEIYIVSYETLRNDVGEFGSAKFDLCVLDEAQKIKNPTTKVHRAVKQLMPKFRWALTGTPLENSVDDVIAIFSFLKPGLFYEDNADWYTDREVRLKMWPYLLRRTIEDVAIELPELTQQDHWLDLLPEQSRTYRAMEDHEVEALNLLGVDATRVHVFALITKLKQLCNYDDSSGESCKLNFLEDELDALSDSGEKALVFSQYPKKTLQVIEPRLRQYKPLTYDGSMSGNKRDEVVRRFEEDEVNGVLLMSLKAGGVGLTLTRANHVFLYDHWWNPAVMDQAVGRVRRIGQKRPVFSHSLYAVGTIEERIHNLLKKKSALFQEMFDQGPATDIDALNRLTDEDLFGLFGLETPSDGEEPPKPAMQDSEPSKLPGDSLQGTQAAQDKGVSPSNLYEISPIEFEEAIRDLLHWWKGFLLHTTNASYDGGIDLDGYSQYPPPMRVVVQCKRYKETVSVGKVREFYGAVASEGNIGASYVVTTGKFSDRATRFARRMGITLIDGVELDILWREFQRQSERLPKLSGCGSK